MNATIEIDGLRKRFGPVQALDGMTFTAGHGHVTGFVGPNGAGKSTTMRVVLVTCGETLQQDSGPIAGSWIVTARWGEVAIHDGLSRYSQRKKRLAR